MLLTATTPGPLTVGVTANLGNDASQKHHSDEHKASKMKTKSKERVKK